MRHYLGLTTREVQRHWLTHGMVQRVLTPLLTTGSLFCQRQPRAVEKYLSGSEAVLGAHASSFPTRTKKTHCPTHRAGAQCE